MKMLKIVGCNNKSKWYSSHIGELFPLLAVEETEFKTRAPSGYLNFVSLEDGKVVEVNDA